MASTRKFRSRDAQAEIGIIGGSGLYDMPGLSRRKKVSLDTPWGKPSGPYVLGTLEGRKVAFLGRHGPGHSLMPSEINYRTNIFGFKRLGAKALISISAVGSMRERYRPRDIVFPDQFFDRTLRRPQTFFGGGVVAHIAFDQPVCPALRGHLLRSARALKFAAHDGGVYFCIEGPQFSTLAESRIFRKWGAGIIGMTNLPEARLAREAQLCYSTVGLVTDYDCWKHDAEQVSVEQILDNMRHNGENARALVRAAMKAFPENGGCACRSALRNAVLTSPAAIPGTWKRRLEVLQR
jgi:5'-methylthioadenosine phosphorylase